MADEEAAGFGDLLRQRRLAAGLTQAELAERAGLSVRGINDLERGARQHPRKDTVALLADALGLLGAERAAFAAAARGTPSLPPLPTGRGMRPSPTLPLPPTPLIDREREVAEVCALLRRNDVRLVTLTGLGGVGKTRLGLQVAAELNDTFADGVWFVRLSRLADPALVLPTTANTLGLREAGNQPIAALLWEYVRTRAVLLVLDNFEQVVAAASELAELLEHSPGLKALVTSRVALHLRGEHEYPLPPLALPPGVGPDSPRGTAHHPPAQLTASPAVALFLQRAQEAQPAFRLTTAIAPAVAAICARLDGLPLALELAAARVKLLLPAALLQRLEHSLPLLVGGARDLEARQQTLRGTLAWSEALLQPAEQRLFQRLAVFVGGFTLESAEAVCAAPEGAEPVGMAVLDGLGALVDHSLVQPWSLAPDPAADEQGDDEARFRMLYVVREYAQERLDASGDAEFLRRAHAVYYLGLVEERIFDVWRAEAGSRRRRLEREHDNFRAALRWARERGEVELGLRLAVALTPFWFVRGHITEGRGWVEGLLALASPRGEEEAGDDDRMGELGVARMSGMSLATHAKGLAAASEFALEQKDYERAQAAAEAALALARGQPTGWAEGQALAELGQVMWGRGDLEQAMAYLEESVARLRVAGEPDLAANYLAIVGSIALERGDLEQAKACCEESLASARRTGAEHAEGMALACLTHVARQRGDRAGTESLGREQLRVWQRLGEAYGLALGIEDLALAAATAPRGARQADRAARLLGAAAAQRERMGIPRKRWWGKEIERAVAQARVALGEEAWAAALAAGQAMSLEEAIAEALD